MKIKEGFILRKVGGSNVIVPTGNETNELVKTITEEFEIDSETATKDVEKFIEKMKDANIFE